MYILLDFGKRDVNFTELLKIAHITEDILDTSTAAVHNYRPKHTLRQHEGGKTIMNFIIQYSADKIGGTCETLFHWCGEISQYSVDVVCSLLFDCIVWCTELVLEWPVLCDEFDAATTCSARNSRWIRPETALSTLRCTVSYQHVKKKSMFLCVCCSYSL